MSTKVLLNKVGAFTHSFLDIYIYIYQIS